MGGRRKGGRGAKEGGRGGREEGKDGKEEGKEAREVRREGKRKKGSESVSPDPKASRVDFRAPSVFI